MGNEGIVRNRLKMNPRSTMRVRSSKCNESSVRSTGMFGLSLAANHSVNKWDGLKQLPASTLESDALSKDLSKRGFRFVGTTICTHSCRRPDS